MVSNSIEHPSRIVNAESDPESDGVEAPSAELSSALIVIEYEQKRYEALLWALNKILAPEEERR